MPPPRLHPQLLAVSSPARGPSPSFPARLAPETSLDRLVRLGGEHRELSILLVGTGPGRAPRADLRRCTAHGDSGGDAGMLAAVGRGVCINPDSRLRGLAALRGWEIRQFRLRPRELGHPERWAAEAVTVG